MTRRAALRPILAARLRAAFDFAAAIAAIAAMSTGVASAATIAIEHVTVLPMTADGAARRDMTVLIRAGRIVSIGETARVTIPASGVRRIDGSGRWLMPALADMHVHFENARMLRLWRGDDRARDDTVRTEDIAVPYVANGVLQIANLSAMSESIGQRIEIEGGRALGPHMALAAMIDGSPPDWPPGMTRVAANPADGRQAVRDAIAEGYDFIKVYNRLDPRHVHGHRRRGS